MRRRLPPPARHGLRRVPRWSPPRRQGAVPLAGWARRQAEQPKVCSWSAVRSNSRAAAPGAKENRQEGRDGERADRRRRTRFPRGENVDASRCLQVVSEPTAATIPARLKASARLSPPRFRMAVTTTGSMIAVPWHLPACARATVQVRPAVVQTIMLPVVVTAILIVWRTASRWPSAWPESSPRSGSETNLKDTRDAVYIFAAVGIGFRRRRRHARHRGLLSVFFCALELLLWKLDLTADHEHTFGLLCLPAAHPASGTAPCPSRGRPAWHPSQPVTPGGGKRDASWPLLRRIPPARDGRGKPEPGKPSLMRTERNGRASGSWCTAPIRPRPALARPCSTR